MEIKIYKNIEQIQSRWEYLYACSPYPLSPFSSYTYYRNCLNALRWRFKGYELTPLFFYCKDGDNEAIFLLIKKKSSNELTTITVYSPVDYYEVLSNNANETFIVNAIGQIIKQYQNYSIRFDSIHEDSLLYKVLKKIQPTEQSCVKIDVDTYDTFYSGLSKHQRQNLRTIYNRLSTLQCFYEVKEYEYPIPSKVIKNCNAVFYHRRLQRMCTGMRIKSKVKILMNAILAYIKDPILASKEQSNNDVVIFQLTVTTQPIAFIIGMYNHAKDTFYVARLAGDKRYAHYSPGILLLNEVIKILVTKGVRTIDLTRGDEPYKLAMGGHIHHNYSFTLDHETIKQIH